MNRFDAPSAARKGDDPLEGQRYGVSSVEEVRHVLRAPDLIRFAPDRNGKGSLFQDELSMISPYPGQSLTQLL
jgi:hypothetical protein